MVVVRHTADGWRVLLLRAYRNWDFPKGLVEGGESMLETARREAREETGLSDLSLDWGEDYCETPPYGAGKVARFYLARTGEEKIVLGLSTAMGRPEHHEYRWLSFAVARRLLVPRLRAVLDWATEHLNTGQDGPGAALPR
jgi:8-oxo-dGTP pyrophosphatase MutT (NUDIX family)